MVMKVQLQAREYTKSLRQLVSHPDSMRELALSGGQLYVIGEIHSSALARTALYAASSISLAVNYHVWYDSLQRAAKRILRARKKIMYLEFHLYTLLEPDGFFLEGSNEQVGARNPSRDPAAAYARRRASGIPLCYLDDKNPYFEQLHRRGEPLTPEEYEALQRERETIWVERIRTVRDYGPQRPVLRIGAYHADDGYGLITALRNEGMRVTHLNPWNI